MSETVHVLGAGVVGICTALSLLERGFQVELIDRDPPASGASHGNAGVVSPWSCIPQSMPGVWKKVSSWLLRSDGPLAVRWSYLPHLTPWLWRFFKAGQPDKLPAIADAMSTLNRPNIDLYRYHLSGTGSEHLLADSLYIYAYRDPAAADLSGLAWRMRAERGTPMERIDDGALREIEPAISPLYKAAIVIKDQARARDPGALARALAEKAFGMGARFRRVAVERIRPGGDGGWMLDTDGGEIAATKLVIAAGAWSAKLLKPLGLNLPLEAERGYHMVFTDPGITLNNSVLDVDLAFVSSSMTAGVRSAGTAEFSGLDAPPDFRRAKILAKLAKGMFPKLNTDQAEEWMGTRPSFPDSLPCLGEIPGMPGLFAAFGHSHYGFGMAPNSGRLLASLIQGEKPNVDMAPYRADRFV